MSSNSKKCRKKSGVPKGAILILLILVALLITAVSIYRNYIQKPDLPPVVVEKNPVVTVDPETGETAPVESEDTVEITRKSENFYTVLLVGTDTVSASTDTIMLASYDVANQKATVMSIPRDTLVSTFGVQRYTRINSVYAAYGGGEAGMDALADAVSELVGFTPDYKVFVQWELVGAMVEALGGVEYDVPFHMEYDDPAQDLHIYVEKGLQKLNGDQAMQVVRWRKNNPGVASGGGSGSDLGRLKVQQGFLRAVLKQTLQIKNMTKIDELARLFSEHVEGDLSMQNVLWFAKEAVFGGLNVSDVQFITMPWKAANPYVYPDGEELLKVVNTQLNPFNVDIKMEQLDLIYFDDEGRMMSTGQK